MVIVMYNRTLEGSSSDLGIMKIHVVNSIPQILVLAQVQNKHLENVILAQSALYITLCWLVVCNAFPARVVSGICPVLCSDMMDS